MDADLALTLGLVIGAFAIPSAISALSDGRVPRASAITVLIAGALILFAVSTKPGGYTIAGVSDAFFGVIARFIP
jgi:hypothetical protein